MNLKKYIAFSTLLSTALLVSCGGGGGGGGGSSSAVPVQEENRLEIEMLGAYQGLLYPLNQTVAGNVTGALMLVRERDDLIASLRFSGGPASILHIQNVHEGSRCPTLADDLNQDGFIDAEEGAKVYGGILIPLDDDLNSQRMGLGTFPVADEYGHYSYSKIAKWDKFMEDLREEDINLQDDYVKLPANKNMTAAGKVVVVFGVPSKTDLPSTVAGRGRLTNFEALPIACGVIQKVITTPGYIDTDHTGIPFPGGESIGGGNGGDDGAIFTGGSTTGGGSGNYGEDREEERGNGSEPSDMGTIHPDF